MSRAGHDDGAPITPGSPLGRALDDFAVPDLTAGFADKVLAAAEVRPAPLPELRRSGAGRATGWRLGRRIAIGVVGFSALATAAAATGLLEQVGLPVPAAGKVWASITGTPPASVPAPASAPLVAAPVDPAPATLAPVRIDGPIDTPEELGEAFRRIDEVRQGRSELRRQQIEARITREKERRAAAGLPLPTPEEEARIRQRLEAARLRREGELAERIEARREELRARIESGEALTREDIVRPLREDQRALQQQGRLERMRQMSPEQRRALREAWQERRAQRLGEQAPAPLPQADTAPAPEAEPPR